MAVPRLWPKYFRRGERNVLVADHEAPDEAGDRTDVAGEHDVRAGAQETVGLPGHVVPRRAGGRVEELGPDAEEGIGSGDLLVERCGRTRP